MIALAVILSVYMISALLAASRARDMDRYLDDDMVVIYLYAIFIPVVNTLIAIVVIIDAMVVSFVRTRLWILETMANRGRK